MLLSESYHAAHFVMPAPPRCRDFDAALLPAIRHSMPAISFSLFADAAEGCWSRFT